ncbi:hypothetical protein Q9251_01680 [Alkalihalobacillus macyae]|uniref:DUF4489 domain-containing protein n=1 Tax=Guptibacillus hwajinpoensis TaxID=208199 RepID=UPI00273CD08A|nr:hypothetical protein [Alkalihalobacillus macyae]MDP4549588.1 hypothetical protein [Alkalihalobacillus macyae]
MRDVSKVRTGLPFITCGRTFDPALPDQLDRSEPPILLAQVCVDPRIVNDPCVLVKYSEFIQFILFGLNPKFVIFYRLVRVAGSDQQILQEWEFQFQSTSRIGFGNLDTIQPTVLNFCDCLTKKFKSELTYQLQIVEIQTKGLDSYDIRNKSITGTIVKGQSEQ